MGTVALKGPIGTSFWCEFLWKVLASFCRNCRILTAVACCLLLVATFPGHFKEKILVLTVSQSPDVEQMRRTIWGYVMGSDSVYSYDRIVHGRPANSALLVLDDVWSISVLEKLIPNISGCKALVVSRFKFTEVLRATYEVELLRESEAIALFCHYAFGQQSIPLAANHNLVKQVRNKTFLRSTHLLPNRLVVLFHSFVGKFSYKVVNE